MKTKLGSRRLVISRDVCSRWSGGFTALLWMLPAGLLPGQALQPGFDQELLTMSGARAGSPAGASSHSKPA